MTDAPSPPTFGAVILAGGKSSRMGQPKAWLPWRGKPLLTHIVDVVASVCNHPIVVVGVPGMEFPPLHPSAVRVDDPTEFEQGGPLVGLFTGLGVLAAHQTDIAYLGACDNLFLTPDYLRLLLDSLVAEPGLAGILPVDAPASGESTDRHYPHPLASAVRVAAAHAAAREVLAKGGSRPLFMFDRIGARWLDTSGLPDAKVVRTCNTPQEYEEALAFDAAHGLPGAGA
ncbi:MAG: NTP transferase domain-containing protein [Nannocystis sp.]|nr:NTP transferase domain-containing protein [Nannocystis sp.]MBA3545628.1 NTP transferase domain-containing protein [Nannocystis sp.]